MPISNAQFGEVEAREFAERWLGRKVSSLRLVETVGYGDLAPEDDRIYEVETADGKSWWLVWDTSFWSNVYPRESHSAKEVYALHVGIAAECRRRSRRTLSSWIEERAT